MTAERIIASVRPLIGENRELLRLLGRMDGPRGATEPSLANK